MGRLDEFNKSSSPVKKYLSWSSNENSFTFWNPETEKVEAISLPYKFIVLKEMHTVVGWSDSHSAAIYSNQVEKLGDNLTVKVKGTPSPIAEGKYADIKERVKSAGGRYAKMLYVYDGNEIHVVTIKGAAMTAFINFSNENKDAVKYNFITVATFESKKKGATKYSEPVFTAGEKIEGEAERLSDEAYEKVKEYIKSKIKHDDDAVPAVTPAVDEFDKLLEDTPFE